MQVLSSFIVSLNLNFLSPSVPGYYSVGLCSSFQFVHYYCRRIIIVVWLYSLGLWLSFQFVYYYYKKKMKDSCHLPFTLRPSHLTPNRQGRTRSWTSKELTTAPERAVRLSYPFFSLSHQTACFKQFRTLAGGCQKRKLAGKRQAELQASEWREVTSQVSLGMPSESSKSKPFLHSRRMIQSISQGLTLSRVTSQAWEKITRASKSCVHSDIRASIERDLGHAHCKCNSLRPAATNILDLPLQKALF